MNYASSSSLALVACPGGEVFAGEVIRHLKQMYHHKASRTAQPNTPAEGCHTPRFKVPARFSRFPNGEIKAEILESIRGKDLYIVQDVENHYPLAFNEGAITAVLSVNDHLMTLLVTVDAAKQAGAGRITVVLPVYPYSRQHRRKSREGVTASRVGNILETLGVERIITLDIHSREIGNGFTTIGIENLYGSYQIIRAMTKMEGVLNDDLVVVSPDTGAVDRNKLYATAFKKPLALLYKERDYSRVTKDAQDNNIAEIKLLGCVQGKTVFMADDMLGTGGTLLKAMKFLREQGAVRVIAAISLPLFSGQAIKYFDEAYREGYFYRIIGTNAVYQEEVLTREWYQSVNITGLFAQIISRLHQGQSLASLLDNREIIEKLLTAKQDTPGDQT